MPPTLAFPDSDDEDDAGPSAPPAPAALGGGLALDALDISDDNLQLPSNLAGLKLPASTPPSSSVDPMSQTSFMLSQSGAFKTADFQIRKEGGLQPINEAATATSEPVEEQHARPGELSQAHQMVAALEVSAAAPSCMAISKRSIRCCAEVSAATATLSSERSSFSSSCTSIEPNFLGERPLARAAASIAAFESSPDVF